MLGTTTTNALVITHVSQLSAGLKNAGRMPAPHHLLMVKPTHFSVDYVINPHMEGNLGSVDKAKAYREWEGVRDAFKTSGLQVHEIEGQAEMPDMVFSANHALPFIDEEGNKETIMSIMRSDHRKGEVPFIEQWYRLNGYKIHHMDHNKVDAFEGMGDAIWHHKKRLLWGGYGFRTSLNAYDYISQKYKVPVIALELKNPAFYHLDTCMCILDEDSVLIYPQAFTDEGLAMIKAVFKNVIEASHDDAERSFACNAVSDGKSVVIQKGSEQIVGKLKDLGFTVHKVETEEFIKSGGSVFCMKCMIW
ncbi:MAG: arginine deiminase-related protein [Balneolales bacterium]